MVDDERPSIGDLLRRARRDAGLTQEDLAGRAGVSVRGISDLERGVNRAPRRDTLELLAEALGLPADERARWERLRRQQPARTAGRSADTRTSSTNLPAMLDTVLGREREIAAVRDLLAADRLVTLTGPGGIGKTRLAIALGHELAGTFAEGVVLVDLAPVREPALVLPVISRTLKIREFPGQALFETVKETLHAQHLLLIVDNFEHVVEAAPILTQLVESAPQLTVLVTSRVRLALRGERVFPVPVLDMPAPGRQVTVGTLSEHAATALFVERAEAAAPDFRATNANAPAIAAICRRLDGLPLAIELAAARTRVLPPQMLLERLTHALDVLSGGARDLPERQQTLRATLAWSYDLLTPTQRAIFRRLTVFVGGWSLEAAELVCAGNGQDPDAEGETMQNVVDALGSLVDQSLVQSDPQPDGSVRFSMLETLREYGFELLEGSLEADETFERLTGYVLDLVERAERELHGRDQGTWLRRLDNDRDNVRAVLSRSLDRGDAVIALRLAVATADYWMSRSLLLEGRLWLERALASNEDAPIAIRAAAYSGLGSVASTRSDYPAAEQALERALALLQTTDRVVDLTSVLDSLGWTALFRGHYERAGDLFELALRVARSSGDDVLVAGVLASQGVMAAMDEQYALADATWHESLALFRSAGDRLDVSRVLTYLAYLAMWQGDIERAQKLGEESLAIARDFEDSWIVTAEELLGYVALERGDYDQAGTMFVKGLARGESRQSFMGIAERLEGLAGVALGLGAVTRGATMIGAAAAIRERIGAPLPPPRRDRLERTLAGLQAVMSDAAFAAAWEDGRSMTVDEALAFAQSDETT